MGTKEKFLKLLREESPRLEKDFGVLRLGIFGSAARGKEKRGSDVDVLVEFKRKSFDNYMELKFYLEKRLGRQVDLVIASALKPALAAHILKEVKYAS